ncbi:hypothetical protein TELCIR_20529 [Teladorsagia circumcincta]|uniref:PNPLA domain-containing protein n=1 Tax=Teladorsagia circumcincta TaxID=45464 RepID=A0A2G9TJ98_TELCI|nr:hypothetical protein TELCIR_20529 [Teladorsagia circumcincta]
MLCHGKTLSEAKRFFIENRFRVFCGNKAKVPKHDAKGVEDTAKEIFGLGHMGSFPKDGPNAAPFYFDSYNGLSDGGLVANNPTQALIADFLQTTRLEKEHCPIEVSFMQYVQLLCLPLVRLPP